MTFAWDGNPETLAFAAAFFEAEQAERDFTEAYNAFRDSGFVTHSPEDYAMWSIGGYADTCNRGLYAMVVWEA